MTDTLEWEQATYPNTEYIIMNFTRIGSCTGLNVVAAVYNTSSGCTVKKSLGAIDATTIPTSITPVQFPTVTDTTLDDDDVIGFYLDGGDLSNKLACKGKFPFANSNSLVSTGTSCSWGNSSNEQLAMQLWSTDSPPPPPPPTSTVHLPPPPAMVRL